MPLLIISLMVGFGLLMIWAVAQASRRAADNVRQLAETLGLQVQTPPPVLGLFHQEPRASGQRRGKRTEIFSFTTGAGKSRVQWCALSVAPARDGGLSCSLQRQNLGTKLKELFGSREIQVGDPEFDRQWFIQTNQPEFLRAALLPELRQKITALAAAPGGRPGRWQLEAGLVRYAEQGSFANANIAARLSLAAEIGADLAEVAEVFAGERA